MYVKKEITDFNDLRANSWAGALQTLDEVEEQGREDELMDLLEETFYNDVPDETTVNDFLWFDVPDWMDLYGDADEEEEA